MSKGTITVTDEEWAECKRQVQEAALDEGREDTLDQLDIHGDSYAKNPYRSDDE